MTDLLAVKDLTVDFDTYDGRVRVLHQLSFSLARGETLCIVGESGSGKSISALAVLGLLPKPTGHIAGGDVLLDGENLVTASDRRMRSVRGDRISMIFQEPMTSLNPVYSVGEQISEVLRQHRDLDRAAAWAAAVEMLRAVRIPDAERRATDFPHQFSGGMRQRVMIAIALACQPEILIADEPTTALDVTVQAQIFDLLSDLKGKNGTATILITHDMGAVGEMADRVLVMYAGRKVEEGSAERVLQHPAHPYTRALLECRPRLELGRLTPRQRLTEIPGIVPAPGNEGAGCPFASRCISQFDRCLSECPPETIVDHDHSVRCWLAVEAKSEQGALQ